MLDWYLNASLCSMKILGRVPFYNSGTLKSYQTLTVSIVCFKCLSDEYYSGQHCKHDLVEHTLETFKLNFLLETGKIVCNSALVLNI